ncbi:glycosyltransferase [Amphiplicatus metriothermophilus]|uniref:Glycosyl transferases group 1 n=1 Tax=Amphiplicatus metriothermophilus TaxID=1519374 RepID=A0A239PQI4_9PROT|nr:glycosyltransferase [Amphiplicatus metriothermophilus]MBB5518538.1 glycosyltransferase involved in cell wall biosynthesis [Amphiplicatus metriothermophilus]SNT72303.1 Glycosyl transferases group 1 [Amphiplicatus metriothermophilus]
MTVPAMNDQDPDRTPGASGELMVIPSVGFARRAGKLWLDTKFVEGMRLNARLWGGPISAAMRPAEEGAIPFGAAFEPGSLPFRLIELPEQGPIETTHLRGAAVILAGGDMHDQLHLPALLNGEGRPAICYIVEHDQANRYRMIWTNGAPLVRRIKTLAWTWLTERRRLRAFARADGVQANGAPAFASYSRRQSNMLLFFDSRTREDMLARPEEMAARSARLRAGEPLRLVFTGRLERIKGAQDLPAVAQALMTLGVDFTLDVFGAGSLEEEIKEAIERLGLGGRVILHGIVDFETSLTPYLRARADMFVCCHPQSDPSCTYLETYGCGVPIIGYDNAAFEGLRRASGAGWSTPMNRPDMAAREIARLDREREEIIAHAERALAFAREHTFEKTFERRIAQLRKLAKGRRAEPVAPTP